MGYPEVMLRNKLFNYAGQKSASGTSLLISPKPVYGQLQLGDNARTWCLGLSEETSKYSAGLLLA